MINIDYVTKENVEEHNPNWPQLPDHLYRITRITPGSESEKATSLFNLISYKPDVDNIYSDAKDSYEVKYQLLINKRESTGLKHFNNLKALIECWNNIFDIYKNIE